MSRTEVLEWCRTGDIESLTESYNVEEFPCHQDLLEAILYNQSKVIKYLLRHKSFDFRDIETQVIFLTACKLFFAPHGVTHPNRSLAALIFAKSRRVPALELQKALFALDVNYERCRPTIEALTESLNTLPISVAILKYCKSNYLLELILNNSELEPTSELAIYAVGRLGRLPSSYRYYFRKHGVYHTTGNTTYHPKICDFCQRRCTRSLRLWSFEMCMKCRGPNT